MAELDHHFNFENSHDLTHLERLSNPTKYNFYEIPGPRWSYVYYISYGKFKVSFKPLVMTSHDDNEPLLRGHTQILERCSWVELFPPKTM